MKPLFILLLAQFGGLYPLFTRAVPVAVIGGGYHRFNLGTAVVVLGMATLISRAGSSVNSLTLPIFLFGGLSLVALGFLWHRAKLSVWLMPPLTLGWGTLLAAQVAGSGVLPPAWPHYVAILLSGLVLSAVMAAMVLGHWYLNEPSLPIGYLQKGTRRVLLTLVCQVTWITGVLIWGEGLLSHRSVPAWQLLASLEGAFLWIGLLMGILAGGIVSYLAHRSARIQSTQSATGLLYVVLILVVMGLVIFNHALLTQGLPL